MVLWLFAVLGLVVVVVIGLVVLGRETSRLAVSVRPAVFDMAEAVEFIADRLPPEAQARLTHDDVRWVLLADADLLEAVAGEGEVDPDEAVARILDRADGSGRELEDADVVAVLEGRTDYLVAIGAIGPEA
ncbi:MAG: hypothetical protein KDA98_17370 [Acidimicrobiales bacterium]|nr:hypothetical protein [Acidimicrobiales bacterium]